MILVLLLLAVGLWLAVLPAWAAAPVGWAVCAYLLWRAAPGVRADLASLRGRRLVRPWRRSGGAHL